MRITFPLAGILGDIVLFGAAIGLAAWLLGLIADRASLIRLALTVAGAILRLGVAYLAVLLMVWVS